MKALGFVLFALAIASGICGAWIAMASLSWASFQAWTWNDDVEDGDEAYQVVRASEDDEDE
jgi:hypothetical protein